MSRIGSRLGPLVNWRMVMLVVLCRCLATRNRRMCRLVCVVVRVPLTKRRLAMGVRVTPLGALRSKVRLWILLLRLKVRVMASYRVWRLSVGKLLKCRRLRAIPLFWWVVAWLAVRLVRWRRTRRKKKNLGKMCRLLVVTLSSGLKCRPIPTCRLVWRMAWGPILVLNRLVIGKFRNW